MSELFADIGYKSINHDGEQLCGDRVEVVEKEDGSSVVVLADGLGSGVKANILATLTSKIISTMFAEGLSVEDCVETIAATLPVCSERGVAYSTFTIININNNDRAELIWFDNPGVILLRNGAYCEYQSVQTIVCGKNINRSVVNLREGDVFVAMSDGCPHAGLDNQYDFGWGRKEIADFLGPLCAVGYTAKTLATILLDECEKLYGGKPGDDATACIVKIRQRVPMNLLFGPPADRDDNDRMMSLFFSKQGKHIVCGGTTASIAAKYLGKTVRTGMNIESREIPPVMEIDGVDLVTEGIITINKVVEYAKDYLKDNQSYEQWGFKRDGASLIARLLFEEATDVNFFVGKAVNPAHQNPELPINFNIKMNLAKELTECLKQMGKNVKVSYF